MFVINSQKKKEEDGTLTISHLTIYLFMLFSLYINIYFLSLQNQLQVLDVEQVAVDYLLCQLGYLF